MRVSIAWLSGTGHYFTDLDVNGVLAPSLQKWNGSAIVDVSPTDLYGPWKSTPQIAVSLRNQNIIAVAAGDATQTNAGLWVSSGAGSTWTQLVAPTTNGSDGRYDWVGMSGDAAPVLYPAGTKGKIGFSAGLIGPVVDKRGNLSTAAAVVGLAGFSS